MRQTEWSQGVVDVIATALKHYRRRRGISAEKLSAECEALGYSIPRSIIANLESGRRESVSVPEWLALAAALRVPPLLLLFPIGRQDEMEVLPDVLMSPWRAMEWAENGHHGGIEPPFTEDADTISMFRRHCEFVEMWSQSRYEARRLRELLTKSPDELRELDEDANELRLELADQERLEERAVIMLSQIRATLRRAHLNPPPLPRALDHLDAQAER